MHYTCILAVIQLLYYVRRTCTLAVPTQRQPPMGIERTLHVCTYTRQNALTNRTP